MHSFIHSVSCSISLEKNRPLFRQIDYDCAVLTCVPYIYIWIKELNAFNLTQTHKKEKRRERDREKKHNVNCVCMDSIPDWFGKIVFAVCAFSCVPVKYSRNIWPNEDHSISITIRINWTILPTNQKKTLSLLYFAEQKTKDLKHKNQIKSNKSKLYPSPLKIQSDTVCMKYARNTIFVFYTSSSF